MIHTRRLTTALLSLLLLLVAALSGCSSTDPTTETPPNAETTEAGATPDDADWPWHEFNLIRERQKNILRLMADIVRQRGGTDLTVHAAVIASSAESNWRTGTERIRVVNGTDYRDIFGWPNLGSFGVESNDAVISGTNSFMDAVDAVAPTATDPVDYAVAVQLGNPRGYDIDFHFPDREPGRDVATLYEQARERAAAAIEALALIK